MTTRTAWKGAAEMVVEVMPTCKSCAGTMESVAVLTISWALEDRPLGESCFRLAMLKRQ